MGDSCFSVAFFFVHAGLLQLYLYDVPHASIPVSDDVYNTVDEFLKCCGSSNAAYSFLHFRLVLIVFFHCCILKARHDTTRLHQSGCRL